MGNKLSCIHHLTLIMAVFLFLTGCTSSIDKNTDPGTESESDPAAGDIHLSIATWSGGESWKLQQQVADRYMSKHPNVHVTLRRIQYEHYKDTVLSQAEAGSADDLILLDNWLLAPLAEAGVITDLTPYIQSSNGIHTADYYQPILQFGQFRDKPYALPKDWSNMSVLYNKSIFDEAGIPYPTSGWTWEELVRTAGLLTARHDGTTAQWGLGFHLPTQDYLQPLLLAYSDGIIRPDGWQYEGYMNSEGMRQALQLFSGAWRDGILTFFRVDPDVDTFADGKVAMVVTGRWSIEQYKKMGSLSFGAVQLPVGPKGYGNMIFFGGWGLNEHSKHKAAAWDLLKYMSGPEGSRVFGDYGFSANKLVAEEKGQTLDPDFRVFMDDLSSIKTPPEYYDPFFLDTGAPALQAVLERIVNDSPPFDLQQALDEAARKADELLAVRSSRR